MTEQSRTLKLTDDEWGAVEQELLMAAERSFNMATARGVTSETSRYFENRHRSLMIAVRQIQTQGVSLHDGGPVGTARYTVR